MVDNDRLSVYLRSLESDLPEGLSELERSEREAFIPIIRKEEQAFLRTVLALKKPLRILEIGTGTGFSALFMREYAPAEASITTIEVYEPRIEAAGKHFAKFRADNIELLAGDAALILPELSDPFDLIFLDAAKGQYPILLPQCKRLLAPGGILLADNVLQGGMILSPREDLKHRDRSLQARMRDFLYDITHDSELESAVVPLGDGMSISVKK